MITIYRGEPGQGKTYFMSLTILDLIARNKLWQKKGYTKELRPIATNMDIADWVKKTYPKIIRWNDLQELISFKGADVFFDDMSNWLDAQRWADTPQSVKQWLRFHEHYGVEIYGNAQDFSTVEISVRRLTTELYSVKKIIGSRRPGENKPPVKRVWGVFVRRQVDLTGMKNKTSNDETDLKYQGWPRIEFLKKKVCSVFDTTQDFDDIKWPHLHHSERSCPTCGKLVIKHI